jgi:hemerythrin-like domain-containing protein
MEMTMDEIMGARIKEIIAKYPEVGTVLNDFGVACVTCAVGTCLLKDILEIHHLSPEDEQKMMTRIAGIVYPGKNIAIPLKKAKPATATKSLSYSPPVQVMVNEHMLIKRLLAVLPAMLDVLDLNTGQGTEMVLACTDFIRSYADKYHHAKEEDILFKYFDQNLDILQVMYRDHETGRAHVRATLEAVKTHDTAAAVTHLKAYRELLTEHIRREDEVLYPWLDRQLSDSQIGRIFAACAGVDERFADARARCTEIVKMMESRFGAKDQSKAA